MNGISLQNVDYATAVQVLRDSGDTVVLVIKRRTNTHQHQHSHSLSASYSSPPTLTTGIQPSKITLTKNSKKEGNRHPNRNYHVEISMLTSIVGFRFWNCFGL